MTEPRSLTAAGLLDTEIRPVVRGAVLARLRDGRLQPQKGPSVTLVTLTLDRSITDTELEQLRLATDASAAFRLPPVVTHAYTRARDLGFKGSSTPEVGRLLAVLAAAVPSGGRILELGTGAGVGLAWIVHGLGERKDVAVISVEHDREKLGVLERVDWPSFVSIIAGDAVRLARTLGGFDLIFADTPGRGKLYSLAHAVGALLPGGILILDDMAIVDAPPARRARLASVRNQLFGSPDLCCTELPISGALLLASRRRQ